MPDPAVVVAMRRHKAGILARETVQMQEMARQWIRVEQALQAEIEALAQDVYDRQQAGETITAARLYRLERYKRLLAQTQDEFSNYTEYADGFISRGQSGIVQLALDHSQEAIQLSYERGAGVYFDRLPIQAVEYLVGNASDGTPLGELLKLRMVKDENGQPLPDVWDRLTNSLLQGTAQGINPRVTAKRMADDLAGGLNKALVISRTEQLRPYREVSRNQYKTSGVVSGQKRLTAHDGRVCGACIADEGTLYSLDEVIPDHPQGRCTSVPVVKGMPEVQWTSGEAWFSEQGQATQISILGNKKRQAWVDGLFEFKDLVTRTSDPTWGKGLTPTPLYKLDEEST